MHNAKSGKKCKKVLYNFSEVKYNPIIKHPSKGKEGNDYEKDDRYAIGSGTGSGTGVGGTPLPNRCKLIFNVSPIMYHLLKKKSERFYSAPLDKMDVLTFLQILMIS